MGSVEADLAQQLNAEASDATRDPAERIAALRRLKDRIHDASLARADKTDLLGQADRYIGDLELRREAQAMAQQMDIVTARENADVRDLLIADGVASADELDHVGWLSHDALDAATEDGSIYESVFGNNGFTDQR